MPLQRKKNAKTSTMWLAVIRFSFCFCFFARTASHSSGWRIYCGGLIHATYSDKYSFAIGDHMNILLLLVTQHFPSIYMAAVWMHNYGTPVNSRRDFS